MNQISYAGTSTALIHFAYPLSDDSPPQHRIACMPNMSSKEWGQTMYHPQVLHTNSPQAVTCRACMKSDQYKKFAERLGAK